MIPAGPQGMPLKLEITHVPDEPHQHLATCAPDRSIDIDVYFGATTLASWRRTNRMPPLGPVRATGLAKTEVRASRESKEMGLLEPKKKGLGARGWSHALKKTDCPRRSPEWNA